MSHKEQSGWVASTSQYTVTNTGGGGVTLWERQRNVEQLIKKKTPLYELLWVFYRLKDFKRTQFWMCNHHISDLLWYNKEITRNLTKFYLRLTPFVPTSWFSAQETWLPSLPAIQCSSNSDRKIWENVFRGVSRLRNNLWALLFWQLGNQLVM